MLPKPRIASQLMSQVGMGRPGGMASRTAPKIKATRGSNFATMENTLLRGAKPNPKSLSAGKPGRQFFNQAAGGDKNLGTKGSTPTTNPTGLRRVQAKAR